jgi:pyruvate dehydrogenase E2 component (dihydrolipoamide acetyltransferase)
MERMSADNVSSQKGTVETVEPTRAERAVIRRSAESRATVPDLELEVVVDLTHREALAEDPDRFEAVVLAAAAGALREHPRLNGAYRDGHYELYGRVNAGVVLGEDPSYPVATVFDADGRSPEELAEELGRLRARAASGELSPPELSGATFSFWCAGRSGLDRAVLPVIPPHAAALVAGRPRRTPVVRDAVIVPGVTTTLTLACDHRIAFGRVAADYLTAVQARIGEEKG